MESIAIIIVALIEAINLTINACINRSTNKKADSITEIKEEIVENRKKSEDDMRKHVLEDSKTYLVDFLSELEIGVPKTEIQKKRAYEIYEEYCNSGGNSYVHNKWEECGKKGLL